VQSGDVFWVEDYAALAGVVVFEDAVDLAGDVSELVSNFAVIKPRLRSTGVEGCELRVIVSAKNFHDFGVADPIALPPLDQVTIHIVEEDLFSFLGGLGLNDNFGVLAGVTSNIDLPLGHVLSPSERMLLTPRAPSTAVEGA
jgi:hypothetical protein